MVDANLLKGGVVVVLLLAALAVFDAFGNYANNQITGAEVYTSGSVEGLPDINVTKLKVLSNFNGEAWIFYAVNNTNGDADVTTPFYVVTRLNGNVVRNVIVNELKVEQTGTVRPATGFADSFPVITLKCGENIIEVSADDSNFIKEKYEVNNKRSVIINDECPQTSEVSVKDGWNIIGVNTLYSLISTNCDKDKIHKTVYSYDPTINDYGLFQLDDNLRPYQDLERIKAVWVYNFGDSCDLTSNLYLHSYPSFSIPNGWNMVAVQQNWQGKKLSEVLGECNFKSGLFYNPFSSDGQPWKPITLETTFARVINVGGGFFIDATDCSFKPLS